MADGIKVWDKNGKVTFSTEDITWNYLASYTVKGNVSTVTYNLNSLCSEFLVTSQMIEQVQGDDEAYVHKSAVNATKGGATVTFSRPSGASAANTSDTLFTVFGR